MASRHIKRIAVNTGGGDAPGLNAVIRAVTKSSLRRGWEVYGIENSYGGLLDGEGIRLLDDDAVRGITHQGGTILGTTNRGNPFAYPFKAADGSVELRDVSDQVVAEFSKLGLDALVAIGGDGSLSIAHELYKKGIPVVGVPKTIDNDLQDTVETFGFDTAVGVATDAIDRLHSTAESHHRVMVVEVMGREAGWIALYSGIAGTADAILIPEIPFEIESVCDKVMERELKGRHFSIVVVAEGAKPKGGHVATVGGAEGGRQEVRLGGMGQYVADEIARYSGKETRCLVLGHLQRGGGPTMRDRLIALRFGAAAVRLVEAGEFGSMVALDPPDVRAVPIEEAIASRKLVPLDGDAVQTARDLGVCLGD